MGQFLRVASAGDDPQKDPFTAGTDKAARRSGPLGRVDPDSEDGSLQGRASPKN